MAERLQALDAFAGAAGEESQRWLWGGGDVK